MSGDRSSPSFEMIASTRRKWTRAQKRAIVAEVDAAGGSVSEVARRHGLNASLLFRWRRVFGEKPVPPTPSQPPAFVPLSLPPPPEPAKPSPPQSSPPQSSPPQSSPLGPDSIEITIAGGRTVRVSADVDTAALVRIIEALEA